MITENLADSVVFLTGGSGVLGSALLEKLLRSSKPKKLFVLLRDKETKKEGLRSASQRLADIFSQPLFDSLKSLMKHFDDEVKRIIVPVTGDVSFDKVITDDNEQAAVISETNYVIHCASSVRFDQTYAASFNVQTLGSIRVRNLAAQMPNLRAFLHCSTAFVGVHQPEGSTLFEQLTELPYDAFSEYQALLAMTEEQRETRLQQLNSTVGYPNTYVFCKSMTEHVLAGLQNVAPLPMCIVRPAIVGCAYREPSPGIISSLQGVSAAYLALASGVKKCHGGPDVIADLVPQDICINAMIAALIATATAAASSIDLPIYNIASSSSNPVNFQSTTSYHKKYWSKRKPRRSIGQPSDGLTYDRSEYRRWIYWHVSAPGRVLSCFANIMCCTGPKNRTRQRAHQAQRMADGLYKLGDALAPFSCRTLIASTTRMRALLEQLRMECPEDALLFPFDTTEIDWDICCQNWAYGIHRYILKETDDTNPPATVPPINVSLFESARYVTLCM